MYIAVTDFYDPVGSKKITNRCPDCGTSDCLELILYQKRIETSFSTKITNKVSGMLYCHNTKTEISPVQWNTAIEKIFNTEKQRAKLLPKSIKFNKWFYGLITFLVLLFSFVLGYLAYQNNMHKKTVDGAKNITVGNKVEVLYTTMKNNKVISNGTTWFLVKKIEGDTIWVQRHREFEVDESINFDLNETNFTEEILKASLKRFKDRSIGDHDYAKQNYHGYITNVKKQ